MAAAGLAALQAQRESGRGAHIDASMYEICVQQMREAIEQAQVGERPLRQGNAGRGVYHQDVYPAAGDDRWVALTLPERTDWDRLVALVGSEDIAAWTARQEEGDLLQQLQSAGIAAGVAQDIEDLFEHDPAIAQRRALVELQHPLLGPFGHMRTPISLSRNPACPFRAPGLGEHSLDIARNIAGLDDSTVEELQAAGVFR